MILFKKAATVFLALIVFQAGTFAATSVRRPRCEYLENPMGIDIPQPRLSWWIDDPSRGARQTAYRILVASSPRLLAEDKGDLWDSGKVASDVSHLVPYAGRPLASGLTCWWKVRVWDKKVRPSAWSKTARWTMGIVQASDWQAQWIGSDLELMPYQKELKALPDFGRESESEIWAMAKRLRPIGDQEKEAPAVYLRKEFALRGIPRKATAYICGLGYFEWSLNGRRVGDHHLDPAYTDYERRVGYLVYDVTDAVIQGTNAVGVALGNGWYNLITPHALRYYAADYIDTPRLIFRLEIEYADGSKESIVSGPGWKFTTEGPLRFNCVLAGETFDARREIDGWDRAGFDDSGWKPAPVVAGPRGRLRAQLLPPVRLVAEIPTVKVEKTESGWRFDLGVETVGGARLKARGRAGQKITIRYPGVNTHTLGRYQTDVFILKGQGTETFEPRFSYKGFRFVDVSGLDYAPEAADVTGLMVCSDLPSTGEFACSDEFFNRLQEVTLRTIRDYIIQIPNDPTREKSGWTEDVWNQFECTAYNFEAALTYREWQRDFLDEQHDDGYVPTVAPGRFDGPTINGPWWGGAVVYAPWLLYQFYGDAGVLAESYGGMKKQVDYLSSLAEQGVLSWGLGDWLDPGSDGRPRLTPVPFTSTAAYAWFTRLVSQTARILGKTEDEARYERLAEERTGAFNSHFFDPSSGTYAGGSQTAQILPFRLGLVPSGKEDLVRQRLREAIAKTADHVGTGFVGTPILLTTLSELGLADLAYTLATQKDPIGWYDMVVRKGNSVFKESWDGGGVQMPSLAGNISAWFYHSLAGIRPDPKGPGFKRLILEPQPVGDLTWVKAHYDGPYGRIVSEWRKENGAFQWDVTVPPNSTATIYVPAKSPVEVREGGRPLDRIGDIKLLRMDNGRAVLMVSSGNYHFLTRPAS